LQLDGIDRRRRRDDLHHVPGKIIAMWMPMMVFFCMVFEHSVVNMFLFPSGLMLGAPFSIMDYLIWNEIPTVLGNLVGGLSFTGLTLEAGGDQIKLLRPRGSWPANCAR
jgi:formate/nitrite transporter FocA (FNT family)